MSRVVHITGDEAVKDPAGVLRQARAFESIVVAWQDGSETVISHRPPAVASRRRTIAEAIEILRLRSKSQGLATPDSGLASDMEEIHALYNEPMDDSKWA